MKILSTKQLVNIVLVLAVIIIFYFLFFAEKDKKEAVAVAVKKTKISITEVKSSDIDVYENTIGTIRNLNSINIASEESGLVERVNFQIGDSVKKGDVLAIIDDNQLQNNKASQIADVNRFTSLLKDNKKTLDRYEKLIKEGAVSQAELDKVRVDYKTVSDQLKIAEATLSNTNIRIGKSKVRSEVSGIIQSREINEGDFVSQGQKIFQIVDNSTIIVIASLPEAFANIVRKNADVILKFNGYEEEIKVKIKQIQPLISEETRSIDVIMEVNNFKYNLKPGGTVTVSILLEKKQNVIMIPTYSLILRKQGEVVYILDGEDKVKEVSVVKGILQDGFVEIISGIKVGDKLVTEGGGFLTDEALVSVDNIQPEVLNSKISNEEQSSN